MNEVLKLLLEKRGPITLEYDGEMSPFVVRALQGSPEDDFWMGRGTTVNEALTQLACSHLFLDTAAPISHTRERS